ncbi:cytochrome P450 [Streptomyces sp. S1D4-11]
MTTTSLPASLVPVPRAPGALPGVGHLRQLLVDPTRFLARLPSYGDLVEIRLGPRPAYVVCSPEVVSEILVSRHRDFDKGGPFFDNISVFFGDGLATCPNAKHTRLRRLTQPSTRASCPGTQNWPGARSRLSPGSGARDRSWTSAD